MKTNNGMIEGTLDESAGVWSFKGIPFAALTDMSVERLYSLKGEIVSRGVRAITGIWGKSTYQNQGWP